MGEVIFISVIMSVLIACISFLVIIVYWDTPQDYKEKTGVSMLNTFLIIGTLSMFIFISILEDGTRSLWDADHLKIEKNGNDKYVIYMTTWCYKKTFFSDRCKMDDDYYKRKAFIRDNEYIKEYDTYEAAHKDSILIFTTKRKDEDEIKKLYNKNKLQ